MVWGGGPPWNKLGGGQLTVLVLMPARVCPDSACVQPGRQQPQVWGPRRPPVRLPGCHGALGPPCWTRENKWVWRPSFVLL